MSWSCPSPRSRLPSSVTSCNGEGCRIEERYKGDLNFVNLLSVKTCLKEICHSILLFFKFGLCGVLKIFSIHFCGLNSSN